MTEIPQSLPWNPAKVFNAFKAYGDFGEREVDRVTRNLDGLSDDDKASLVRSPQEQVRVMKEALDVNCSFLENITQIIKSTPVPDGKLSRPADAPNSKTVQTFLQMLVREWSTEGLGERSECFEKLLGALDAHLGMERDRASSSGMDKPRVLCPSSSLARIPFEVASRGYQCDGCESDTLLYFGSELMRSASVARQFCIQPFALNTCNRVGAEDHVRKIQIPEMPVRSLPPVRFGEFIDLYDAGSVRASFDAVLSAYSLDTSPNPLRYIRTVAHVLRPGGLWANFGPLSYDADHDEAHSQVLELSWEELKHAISHFFEVKEESFFEALHAQNCESLMQHQNTCVYFTAVRNEAAAEGIGER